MGERWSFCPYLISSLKFTFTKYIFSLFSAWFHALVLVFTRITLAKKMNRIFAPPPICKASPEENGIGQNPIWKTQKPRKGKFRDEMSKNFQGEVCSPGPPRNLRLRLPFSKSVIIYPRSVPTIDHQYFLYFLISCFSFSLYSDNSSKEDE